MAPTHSPNSLAAPPTATVQIVAHDTGTGTVVLDGHDVTRQVSAAHLTMRAGLPAEVVLQANGSFSYDGPAVVVVENPTAETDADVLARWVDATRAWLREVDWAAVQSQAAEGSMAAPLGEAFRDALLDELAGIGVASGA